MRALPSGHVHRVGDRTQSALTATATNMRAACGLEVWWGWTDRFPVNTRRCTKCYPNWRPGNPRDES